MATSHPPGRFGAPFLVPLVGGTSVVRAPVAGPAFATASHPGELDALETLGLNRRRRFLFFLCLHLLSFFGSLYYTRLSGIVTILLSETNPRTVVHAV